MTNTMADLRREVAERLRDTLHGREIDTMEKGMPELPHMLGIVTIGAISTERAISGSILDPDHQFWDDYYEDIQTENAAHTEVESAVRSLKEDDIFRVSMPYGEDAGIWYCEVGALNSQNKIMTTCPECAERIPTEPTLHEHRGTYTLEFHLNCTECDFSSIHGTELEEL